MAIVYLVLIYFLTVFFLSRFVVPFLGFKERILPEKIPAGMADKINELKSEAGSPEEFLNLSFNYLGAKYRTGRLSTILKFNYLYKTIDEAWALSGFMPCTISNRIMKIFLTESGYFKEEEIKRRHVFLNFLIHQYLCVKVNGRWLNVDVGEKQRGLPFGGRMIWFG